jgi:hypothetical protein
MFRKIRIAILLYILLFVALGEFLAQWRSTNWDESLRVNIYLVNGSDSAATQAFLDTLRPSDFDPLEQFFDDEAARYGLGLQQPIRIRLAESLDKLPPAVPADSGLIGTMLWSLKMRWYVMRLHWSSDSPTPDVTLLAIYHDSETGVALDRSTALRKGLIAIANLYAEPAAQGSNRMVIAHELLHTLGATDKYDRATGLPLYPLGYADPARSPLYPQAQAELMAGRIPLAAGKAVQSRSLREVMIGPETALEIGWTD